MKERRDRVRLVGVASAALWAVGCSLIVGDPHGRLVEPSEAGDGGGSAGDAENTVDAGHDATTTVDGGTDAIGADVIPVDAVSDMVTPPVDAPPACDSGCTEAGATYSCAKGGCNAAGGACTAAGQACACTSDSQCPSGKCIKAPGKNDRSCGAQCTGMGMADGFGCAPAACTVTSFGYAPSNFVPTSYSPPAGATLDCNGTYSSTTHTFTMGSCGGTAPTIHAGVTQTHGGQLVDILVFQSLTISGTLTLVGANPVILAVYGNAKISGTINASASGGTAGAGGNACAAANNGTDTTTGAWEPGAGGGGQSTAGGGGGSSTSKAGGAGGAATTTSTVPLSGGCAGGVPNVGSLGFSPVAGAGGGGVQISAAGSLDLTGGKVLANGAAGGPGEVGKCQALYAAQNGTGGAGGGSGGNVLLEGLTVTPGMVQIAGGPGGAGGAAAAPNNQAGGAGGGAGVAGGPGIQDGGAPDGCTWGGYWSGGGGGGGANGSSLTNASGGSCPCTSNSACSSGVCSNVSGQCTPASACTGTTTAGSYDSNDCEIPTSR